MRRRKYFHEKNTERPATLVLSRTNIQVLELSLCLTILGIVTKRRMYFLAISYRHTYDFPLLLLTNR